MSVKLPPNSAQMRRAFENKARNGVQSTPDAGGAKKTDQATVDKAKTAEKPTAPVEVGSSFAGANETGQVSAQVTGQTVQKEPSKALSQSSRIMSPHLLFQEFDKKNGATDAQKTPLAKSQDEMSDAELLATLLEQPFKPSTSVSSAETAGPVLAELPADRKTPVGPVSYSHDDGQLVITGQPKEGKAETVKKKLGMGAAAQFAAAFDAAVNATYPRFSHQEPQEMWIGLAGAERAANIALKLDVGQRTPYDGAKMLRAFMPGATPVVATQTVMDQIKRMSGLANKVLDGDPQKNLVDLEEQVLNANGSSLVNEILKNHDRKTGARTELDDLLDQPVKPAPLPDDDKAVVASLDGRDVTAGEIREKAFRDQKAVAFQVPGFADEHGSERTLKVQVEKRGKRLEWSFHGVTGDRSRIISGDVSAEGLEKFNAAISKQPRYDMRKYETKVPRFNPRLAQASVDGLVADREKIEQAHQARGGGVKVSDVFPHLD